MADSEPTTSRYAQVLAWLDRYLTPMPVLATSYGKVAAPLLLGMDPKKEYKDKVGEVDLR